MLAGTRKKNWLFPFSIMLTGQVFSLLGSGLVQFSIIWWLTRETGSTLVLTTATICGVLPQIIFSPFAGVLADRVNRKKILIAADAAVGLLTGLMAVLFWQGSLNTGMIYLLLVLRAIGSAFHQPSFESTMPMIVPESQLVRIAAIIQAIRSGVNLVSPMLGAFMIAFMPLPLILLIDTSTAFIALLTLLPVKIPDLKKSGSSPTACHNSHFIRNWWNDFKQGLEYIFHWKGLFQLILLFALSNFLLAPMLSLMPLIIQEHFKGGVTEYGFFETAFAIGIVIGGLTLSVWGGFKRKIISVNLAQVISGILVTLIAFVPADQYYWVLILIALAGITSAYINAPAMAIVQSRVDHERQGRVIATISTICMLAMPVSLIIAGPLANLVGLIPIIRVPGILSILIGLACFALPDLMSIEDTPVKKVKSDALSVDLDEPG